MINEDIDVQTRGVQIEIWGSQLAGLKKLHLKQNNLLCLSLKNKGLSKMTRKQPFCLFLIKGAKE